MIRENERNECIKLIISERKQIIATSNQATANHGTMESDQNKQQL
jgi:hypothetical protein